MLSFSSLLLLLLLVLLAAGRAAPARPPSASSVARDASADTLTLSFVYPDSALSSHALFLRGDGLGLSWDRGIPLTHARADTWEAALAVGAQDRGATLQFKALVDDQVWQIGANAFLVIPAAAEGRGGRDARGSRRSDEKQDPGQHPAPPIPTNTSTANHNHNDPSSPTTKTATTTTTSFRAAPVYPWFYATRGSYSYVRGVYSPQLRNTRDLVVYVPPSYTENTLKRYRALVMHDGQNLFNATTSYSGTAWLCQDTVDALAVAGGMEEVVIVGVDNTANRTFELTYSYDASIKDGGGGDRYLDFIEQEVFPRAASLFRVDLNATAPIGIMGSSLGGLISCYAGYTRSVYARVGCMSSSFWWDNEDFDNVVLARPSRRRSDSVFYLDSGDAGPSDDDVLQTINVTRHLHTLGLQYNASLFYYLDHGGQHSEIYWSRRFHIPMSELYPPLPLVVSS